MWEWEVFAFEGRRAFSSGRLRGGSGGENATEGVLVFFVESLGVLVDGFLAAVGERLQESLQRRGGGGGAGEEKIYGFFFFFK